MYPYDLSGSAVAVVFTVALYAFQVFLFARIVRRVGFDPSWGLLLLLPIAGVIGQIVFAFMDWPVDRELAALREENVHLRDQLRDAQARSR